MKNPIIVALDLDSPNQAMDLAMELEPHVGGFKVGPRLTHRAPPEFIQHLSRFGLVFFDHKFFDIPSTVVSAVQSAAEAGAKWVTVHALNGPETLRQLAHLESSIRTTVPEFRVVVVTVLTSFTPETLPTIWNKSFDIKTSVEKLAEEAMACGLTTFVCSPQEVASIKEISHGQAFVITPGVRPLGADKKDQARTATPLQALKSGANALVIGRPIIADPDPVSRAKEIYSEIKGFKT